MSVNDLIKEGVSLFKSNNFDQAIAKFNQALDEIEDKNSQLEERNHIQFWLGRCYLEQALKIRDITEAKGLFAQAIEHHQEQLKLAKQLTDEQTRIQGQINAQSWLGRCYFEQALKVRDITEAKELFAQAIEHHQERLKLAKQLTNEQTSIQNQINAQFWLGRCYLEQALKVRDITEAKGVFAQAIEHHQEQLKLAKQLTDEQTGIHKQINAQSWLGGCYLEQAMKVKNITEAKGLFAQAIEHYQERLKLAKQLTNEQTSIQEQNNAQFWFGRCYFEQARKVRDITEAKRLFTQAIERYQERLKLAKQLTGEQTSIQKQINAQHWLGRCYLEQAMKVEEITEAKYLFVQAIDHHKQKLKLTEHLQDKQICIYEQSNAQYWLGRCYSSQGIKIKNSSSAKDSLQNEVNDLFKRAEDCFLHSLKLLPQFDNEQERYRIENIICYHLRNICFLISSKWNLYFDKKKQEICEILFLNKDRGEDKELNEKLKDAISTILAVLNILPIELGSTPLAHYTSSTVCNKLFGVVNEEPSPMRIGSSSYMNDPSEGKGLLELLALQDFELENKADCSPHNAFFACFSSRVNDLNQFRLYGKEDGVEASGCCLVFNKNGDWLKVPDISAPFRSITKNQDENLAEFKEANISNVEYESLPLYQVAYIAYKDEYIAEEKCQRWLDNSFGICLKTIGGNEDWHNFRLDQLKEALQELIGFFKEKKDHINDKNKNALEYIRYLFKDFAFRDEEEFRVLKMAKIGSTEIEYCKTTQSIYLPYADISNVVDEVILGTNYEKTNSRRKAEVFQHQMKQKCPYVRVSRSSLPIYANPPIKKS